MTTIQELFTQRNQAWAAFNPASPPGKDNDFITLLLVNLEWHKASGAEWGDQIDGVITRYSLWIRYTRKKPDEKPPASVWSGTEKIAAA